MTTDRSGSSSRHRWFDEARRRLTTLTGGTAAAEPPVEDPDLPQPEPLARLLVDIAALWAAARSEPHVAGRPEERIDSPEALAAFADGHDIDVQFENRAVASLRAADLPAVMLTREGAGRMLVGRAGDVFTARGEGRTYEIAAARLADEEAGTLFLVRTRNTDAAALETPATAGEVRDEAGLGADPVRGVMHHMLVRQRSLMIQLMVAAAFSNMMLLALPIYSNLVFDRVIPHSAFDTLWAVSLGVLLALGADLAVRWVRLKLQDAVASAASAALQARVVRRLLEVKMIEAPRSAGALAIRLREIDGLTQLVPQFLTGVVIDAPFLLFVFALIWINGGPVVLAPVVGMAILGAVHHVANLGAKDEQIRSMKLAQVQTNQLIETVECLEAIKTSRIERRVLGRFERMHDDFSWSSHVTRLWHGFAAYANLTIGQAMVVMVMVIGVYQISAGAMTVGGLSACSLLVGRVISPIGQLVTVIHRMHQSRATLTALSNDASGASETAGDRSGAVGVPQRGAMRLQGVSFSYPGQTSAQVDGIDLRIEPGEKVAIIGRSGSGKSTLLKLMTRLIEPERGAVLVDDLDARQYVPSDLRRVFGYMSQTPGLVDDTLLVNLTLGLDAVDPSRLDAIVRLTGVAEFAARHPQGFAMGVGPRGERLSGGERQSVALARLLLADPKVMLLDEPTAAMDTMLEARLVRDLKAHLGQRTLVVATHRAPILELADRLIWLDGGRIVADGPKAEVMRRLSGAAS